MATDENRLSGMVRGAGWQKGLDKERNPTIRIGGFR